MQRYAPLTREQKRRKQQIRNWRRSHEWVCDWNKQAVICATLSQKQAFLHSAYVARKMFYHIFDDEDKQETALYQSDILSEEMALSVLN